MKQLLCFDLDNTLIHSDKAHVRAFNKGLKYLKQQKRSFYDIAKHFGKPKTDVAKAILPKNQSKLIPKLLNLHDHYLATETYSLVKRISGVESTLKTLKKRYKIALLSNCRHRNIHYLLKGANIEKELFDIIIGNDDVEHSKPYPDEIFKAEHLAKEKALFMIGDSPYDIRAAKKARVKAISVLTGLYTKETLEEDKPDYILKSVKDLPKFLEKKHI